MAGEEEIGVRAEAGVEAGADIVLHEEGLNERRERGWRGVEARGWRRARVCVS